MYHTRQQQVKSSVTVHEKEDSDLDLALNDSLTIDIEAQYGGKLVSIKYSIREQILESFCKETHTMFHVTHSTSFSGNEEHVL